MKNKRLFNFGLIILIFIFNILFTTTTLYILKYSISIWNFIISLLLTLLIYYLLLKKAKENLKSIITQILIFIGTLLLSIVISINIYDVSCDGNQYHKVAIGALKNGWNPVYESITEFIESPKNPVILNKSFEIWNDHYAKGVWIYAANTYKVTGNIESGKSISILTIIATFTLCFAYLNEKIKRKYSLIISILLALNPVMIYQFCSYYNDALLGNFILILLLSLTIMIDSNYNKDKKLNYLLYFLTLCILINIKFTGFAYAGIYSLFYFIYILINKHQRKENLKSIIIIASIALFISIGVIGLSTYPKNFIEHKTPFYPLYGEGKVDIMKHTTPTGLHDMNRIKRFIIANTSKTYNVGNNGEILYNIKIPFTFKAEELNEFKYTDIRIGGYGVFFSGILIVSFITGLYLLYKYIKNKKEIIIYLLPIIGTLFLIIILKESWWARYLPQLYLLPIIVVLMLIKLNEKKYKNLIMFLLITLSLNSYLIINSQLEEIEFERNIINKEKEIISLVPEEEQLLIKTGTIEMFDGVIFNIYDLHKNLKLIQESETPKNGYIEYGVQGPNVRAYIYIKEELYNEIMKKIGNEKE